MLYQVTAYELFGQLALQCTTAVVSQTGYQWEHRILEHVRVAEQCQGQPWDIIWLIGQTLQDRAMDRQKSPWE